MENPLGNHIDTARSLAKPSVAFHSPDSLCSLVHPSSQGVGLEPMRSTEYTTRVARGSGVSALPRPWGRGGEKAHQVGTPRTTL